MFWTRTRTVKPSFPAATALSEAASMLYVRDDDLKLAFATLLNKLVYGHKFILKPYLRSLQENSGDESLLRIQHLESLLEKNTEQRETLTKLMAQGYIDQILYNSESNALLSQADEFRKEINALSGNQDGDASRLTETEKLLRFAEQSSMVSQFDELLFAKFVDHILMDSRQEISFILKCGLTLKERIGD